MMTHSNSPAQRIFPPIQPDLYTTSENWTPLTPDQRVAQTILALANQEFTRWEWLVGWKLDALGQIGRLLRQHKLAMEAELAAQWQKADFFWTQVQIEVKRLSRRHNVWRALALAMSGDEPEVVVMGDRFQLRQRLVDELFVDTHFAFYNGLAGRGEKLSLKDRTFVHIDYILKLFGLSDPPENYRRSLLDKAWQQQIRLCEEAGKWRRAMNIRTQRLKYFPQCVDYQNEFAKAHFGKTLDKLETINISRDFIDLENYSLMASRFLIDFSHNMEIILYDFKTIETFMSKLMGMFLGGLFSIVFIFVLQKILLVRLLFLVIIFMCMLLLPFFVFIEVFSEPAKTEAQDKITLLYNKNKVAFEYTIYFFIVGFIAGMTEISPNILNLFILLVLIFIVSSFLAIPIRFIKHKSRLFKPGSPSKVSWAYPKIKENIQSEPDDKTTLTNSSEKTLPKSEPSSVISPAPHLKDVKKIQQGINKLKKLSQNYRYNLYIFDLLADLHHLEALKLVHAGYLAESLVAVQKALTYNPYFKQASATRYKLSKIMEELTSKVRAAQRFQWREPKDDQKTKHLKDQAKKGFTLVTAYLESGEAKAIKNDVAVANAISIWRDIGLPESEPNWKKQAIILLPQLDLVLTNPPQNKSDIAELWQGITTIHPELAELDSQVIHRFLEGHIFGSEDETEVVKPSPKPQQDPLLLPISTRRQFGTEPFLGWLFSRQNIRLKLQAVIAIILVLTAGMVTIQDLSIRSAQNAAYQQILEAEQQQDVLGVVQGAEAFFEPTPLNKNDKRNQQVMKLYSEALVRWMAQQENPGSEQAQLHVERYQSVIKSSNQGGN
jgi:hypothetical protein